MKNNIDTSTLIFDFINSHFPLARKQSISDSTPLLETGIIDSLGVLDLVSFIEKEFNIVVADDDLTPEYFSTVRSIANLVRSRNSL